MMKTKTLLFTSLLLVVVNAGASQRVYFNHVGVANLTGSPISNLDARVGEQEVQCEEVNNNGYCHKRFGKRPFPEDGIVLSWTDSDGNQQTKEVELTMPATMITGRTVRFELEIHSDGSIKWDFRQDGIRS